MNFLKGIVATLLTVALIVVLFTSIAILATLVVSALVVFIVLWSIAVATGTDSRLEAGIEAVFDK